jgi:hypothetical protein
MRLALGVIGLAVVVWPIRDLWWGVASFNLAAPVFGLIGLGGLAIGCAPVAGAVFGRRTVLSVSPTGATLLEENLLMRRERPVSAAEIGTVSVIEDGWSDGPNTWRVSLAIAGKTPLPSEDFKTRAGAEVLAAKLDEALRRADWPVGG